LQHGACCVMHVCAFGAALCMGVHVWPCTQPLPCAAIVRPSHMHQLHVSIGRIICVLARQGVVAWRCMVLSSMRVAVSSLHDTAMHLHATQLRFITACTTSATANRTSIINNNTNNSRNSSSSSSTSQPPPCCATQPPPLIAHHACMRQTCELA
jgi:hypothetical protein